VASVVSAIVIHVDWDAWAESNAKSRISSGFRSFIDARANEAFARSIGAPVHERSAPAVAPPDLPAAPDDSQGVGELAGDSPMLPGMAAWLARQGTYR
jgi:hypothetical protein